MREIDSRIRQYADRLVFALRAVVKSAKPLMVKSAHDERNASYVATGCFIYRPKPGEKVQLIRNWGSRQHTSVSGVFRDIPDEVPAGGMLLSMQGAYWLWDGSRFVLRESKTGAELMRVEGNEIYLRGRRVRSVSESGSSVI
jgi:hypothetical protein